MSRLLDKKVIVTGGGTGIGRGISKVFAREGAKVIIAGINEAEAKETVNEIQSQGGWAIAVTTDIRSRENVDSLVATAVKEMSGIDVVVNNAAAFHFKTIENIEENDWAETFQVNVFGAGNLTAAALPYLKESASPNVINIASVRGYLPYPSMVPYAASKGALLQMTKCLALDLSEYGVRVNAICPGFIRTPVMERHYEEKLSSVMSREEYDKMAAEAGVLKRVGTPEDVANMALFLASDEASFVTGASFVVDGGLTIKQT